MKHKLFLMMVVSALVLFSLGTCNGFNPSFSSFIEEATDPEVQKGFFGYSIVFPSIKGVETHSTFTLHPLEGGADVLNLPLGWLDNAPFDDSDRKFRRPYAAPSAHKIPYGHYRLTLKIGNPQTSAVHEKEIWIKPGRNFEYTDRFYEQEFK